jgi:WXXGXW repeat (2 copies)
MELFAAKCDRLTESVIMNLGVLRLLQIVLLAFTGCVATVTPLPSRSLVASGPPPAPVREEVPASPASALVGKSLWLPGYWHWTGTEYAWIPGHWAEASPGMTWSRPRYWAEQGTFRYEPGRWVKP